MWEASEKADMKILNKYLERPPAEWKFDFTQSGGDCLHKAAIKGNTEVLRLLLDAKADPNHLGGRCLHEASSRKQLDIVQVCALTVCICICICAMLRVWW